MDFKGKQNSKIVTSLERKKHPNDIINKVLFMPFILFSKVVASLHLWSLYILQKEENMYNCLWGGTGWMKSLYTTGSILLGAETELPLFIPGLQSFEQPASQNVMILLLDIVIF